MTLSVRPMNSSEVDIIIDYFTKSSCEHLELLGVDPTRIPSRSAFRKGFLFEFERALDQRSNMLVGWYLDENPIGFSTTDKIVFGDHAYMHLHLIKPEDRKRGTGTECVRRSVDIYFETLHLKRLYCEPNAFNTAPNRTLQKAGFRYLKTHMTVPGYLNYHQAVTRWVVER